MSPVAAVVVSHNTREALLGCLGALVAQRPSAPEVVVVDNASDDGSAAAVRASHPQARVIQNQANTGFARACNQGLFATTAPLVLFMNSDASLAADGLAALVARIQAEPDVGIVAPRLRAASGRIEVSTGPALSPLSELRQRRLMRGVERGEPRAVTAAEARHGREHEPFWVSGACMLARRAALLAVGGFDERFFLYEEDVDLCLRVRAAGWRVVFTPAAEARHLRGRSAAGDPARARLAYDRSHILYYRLHNGPLALLGLRALLAARAGLGFIHGLARGDEGARRRAADLLRLAREG